MFYMFCVYEDGISLMNSYHYSIWQDFVLPVRRQKKCPGISGCNKYSKRFPIYMHKYNNIYIYLFVGPCLDVHVYISVHACMCM